MQPRGGSRQVFAETRRDEKFVQTRKKFETNRDCWDVYWDNSRNIRDRGKSLETQTRLLRFQKVETESIHIDTNRDFQYQKFSNSRQISRLEKSLSRMDETLNFFKFRDETGRDENSRLVSPRNQSRLWLLKLRLANFSAQMAPDWPFLAFFFIF